MKNIKLVAESLQEWDNSSVNNNELNESSKNELKLFLKNPNKNQKAFLSAYSAQFSKKGGDILKNKIAKLDTDSKKKIAEQSLKALEENSEKGLAWIFIKDNKIVKAGALNAKKADLGKELGA